MKEIERKWVIEPIDYDILTGLPVGFFVQGYLIVGGGEFRIRNAGESGYMAAVKIGAGLQREEFEFPVSEHVGLDMLNYAINTGWFIQKRRWHLPNGMEIDEFHDDLKGLWIAEMEFLSEEQSKHPIILPDYLKIIKEVTDDPAYKNQSLAVHGLP